MRAIKTAFTLGAKSVRELNVRVLFQEIFQALPATIGFLNFFAAGANWEQPAKIAEISMRDFQFSPRQRAFGFHFVPMQRQINLHEQFAFAKRF